MKNVEISVIIPVYNVEPYLENCLNSVVNQTFKDIEIICINDGSTDNSGAICDVFAKLDNRIKVVHQSNKGLSVARNVGLDSARGKYISFIDSDDYVHCEFLEVLYKLCEDNLCFISMCELMKTTSLEESTTYSKGSNNTIFYGKDVVHKMLLDIDIKYVVVWNKLYRRECFFNIRFPIDKLHEDEFIEHKVLFNYDKIAYTDRILYYYMQRTDSIVGRGLNRKFLDSIEARVERVNFFDDQKVISEKLYKQSLIALSNSLCYCIENFKKHYINDTDTIECLQSKHKAIIDKINYLSFDKDAHIDYLSGEISKLVRSIKEKDGENIELQNALSKLQEENIQLNKRIEFLSNTWSFKIGQIITFVPRKICGGIKCYKENGLLYTIRRFKEKIFG